MLPRPDLAAARLASTATIPVRRVVGLLDGAERLMVRVDALVHRAEALMGRAEALVGRGEAMLGPLTDDEITAAREIGPDIKDMLVAVTAMRELVESLPGMGRVRRRVEREAESA